MGIKVSSVSKTWQRDVFTDRGLYCGKVEDVECDLKRFKLRSLVIKSQKGSYMSNLLGSKRGLIIPFPMVQAIGDIIIIKHIAGSAFEGKEPPKEAEAAEPAAAAPEAA